MKTLAQKTIVNQAFDLRIGERRVLIAKTD